MKTSANSIHGLYGLRFLPRDPLQLTPEADNDRERLRELVK